MAKAEVTLENPFNVWFATKKGELERRITIHQTYLMGLIKELKDSADAEVLADRLNADFAEQYPDEELFTPQMAQSRVNGIRRNIAEVAIHQAGASINDAKELAKSQENWPESVNKMLPAFKHGTRGGHGRTATVKEDVFNFFQ